MSAPAPAAPSTGLFEKLSGLFGSKKPANAAPVAPVAPAQAGGRRRRGKKTRASRSRRHRTRRHRK
jgi:hypothetical protein